jgi:hypothetical protein
MYSTVSTRLYGRAHHPYATIRSNAPIIRYHTVECIYHTCECMIECTYYMILYGWMHLPCMWMYDRMHLPCMRMYDRMPLLYDTIRLNASTIYVNVWSNAPIIQYYMVECIYHMWLYKWMHLLLRLHGRMNASTICNYTIECIYL